MTVYRVEFITPDGPVTLDALDDEFLLDAASRAGLTLPATCLQGWCTTCAGAVLQGEVDQSAAWRWYEEDVAAGHVLLCTARARSDLRLQTHQQDQFREHRLAHGRPAPRG